jgi:hypothetical protein
VVRVVYCLWGRRICGGAVAVIPANIQIPVDYANPAEFANKLRLAAATHPKMFVVESEFALALAKQLETVAPAEIAAQRAALLVECDKVIAMQQATAAMVGDCIARTRRAQHNLYGSLALTLLSGAMLIAAVLL